MYMQIFDSDTVATDQLESATLVLASSDVFDSAPANT